MITNRVESKKKEHEKERASMSPFAGIIQIKFYRIISERQPCGLHNPWISRSTTTNETSVEGFDPISSPKKRDESRLCRSQRSSNTGLHAGGYLDTLINRQIHTTRLHDSHRRCDIREAGEVYWMIYYFGRVGTWLWRESVSGWVTCIAVLRGSPPEALSQIYWTGTTIRALMPSIVI